MINNQFTPEWKVWIWNNVVNGVSRESLFNVLLNNGFSYNLIKSELDIEPTNSLVWQRQYSQEALNLPYDIEIIPFHKNLSDNPNIYKIETNFIEMYHFPEFLSFETCDKLIEWTDKDLSTKKNKSLISYINKKDPIYDEVNIRLHTLINFDYSTGEDFFVQKYPEGHEEKEHFDYFPISDKSSKKQLDERGQRTWTMIVYLNDVNDGGETSFNSIDKEFKPAKGDVVIWKNVYHDGNENPYTKHVEKPTVIQDKYVLTKYFRAGISNIEPQTENEITIIEIPTID
jgi:prolyl 4-hydroxylase